VVLLRSEPDAGSIPAAPTIEPNGRPGNGSPLPERLRQLQHPIRQRPELLRPELHPDEPPPGVTEAGPRLALAASALTLTMGALAHADIIMISNGLAPPSPEKVLVSRPRML